MKTPVVAGVVIFVVSLTAFVTMSALHLDTTGLLAFVGVAAGIGGFASWQNTETIKRQTNGPLTKAFDQIDSLVRTVATLNARVGKLEGVKSDVADISTQLQHMQDNNQGG